MILGAALIAVGALILTGLFTSWILGAYEPDPDPEPGTGAETWTPALLAEVRHNSPRHAATSRLSAQQRLTRDLATGREFARLYAGLGRLADTAPMPIITDHVPGES